MKTRSLVRFVFLAASVTAILGAACSDQGAVKSEGQKPAAPAAAQSAQSAPETPGAPEPRGSQIVAAPPLVSGHGDSAAALPPGHPPIDAAAAPGLPPVPAGAGTGATALTWKVPSGWVEQKPASPMRRAQYKVPGKTGDGECVVFYFGPGQGGDPISNAQRWADQFTLADGSPAKSAMKTETITVGGHDVFVVEVAGTYKGGMTMTMEPATPKTGYRLLGAVVPGPDANWYFKITGPDATVTEQRDAFLGMVHSMKHGAS